MSKGRYSYTLSVVDSSGDRDFKVRPQKAYEPLQVVEGYFFGGTFDTYRQAAEAGRRFVSKNGGR